MRQLAENEVSIKSLVDCFSSAFMKVVDVEEEAFWVVGESLKTKVSLDEKRKYLRLSIIYQLSGNITPALAAEQCNKVNNDYIVIRFSALDLEGTQCVLSTYYMTFEEGLVAFHLVKMVKKFEQFTVDALREYMADYI